MPNMDTYGLANDYCLCNIILYNLLYKAAGRCGTHSKLIKIDPPHPRGNITSFVTSSNVEHVRHLKTTTRRSMR